MAFALPAFLLPLREKAVPKGSDEGSKALSD